LAGGSKHEGAAPRRWWERALADIRQEARGLVRVSRIDQPEAVLLAPDQAFFLRENLKLRLLNARLALLSRQTDSARADVTAAAAALRSYFDQGARRTQAAAAQLQQVQAQLRAVELPRIDETLAVLATTAAGK
jgi:uroporphyrin-3 C-methyltransferase